MDSIRQLVLEHAECRTPLVVMRETAGNSTDRVVELVKRIATHCDSYLEHVHGQSDDELAAIGKRIDAAIINGDWLLLTLNKNFSIPDFLRFAGRRLFTMMPDVERRPNMELFRLWICLDKTVSQPQVFQHVAVTVDLSVLGESAEQRAFAVEDCKAPAHFSAAQTKAAAIPTSASSNRLPSSNSSFRGGAKVQQATSASRQYEDEIPVDESTCEQEAEFDAAVSASSPQRINSPSVSETSSRPTSSKVGALFHRRLELASGRRPTSSGSRTAEIRKLRVQSAQLARQVSSVQVPTPLSARPMQMQNSVPSCPRPPSASTMSQLSARSLPSTQHATSEAQDAFERATSETLQKLHCALMRSYVHSETSAQRLQHIILEFAESVYENPTRSATSWATVAQSDVEKALPSQRPPSAVVEASALLPLHDFNRLTVDDVVSTEADVTLRRGRWRSLEVLLEQMTGEQYAAAFSGLTRIRCHLKHPAISSPVAVLRDPTSPLTYIVYEYPSHGPLPTSLRRQPPTSTAALVDMVLAVVKAVAVGLQFMHDEGIVHRDVSLQQVFDYGGGRFQLRISNRCRRMDPDGAATAEGVATRWTAPDALFTGRFRPEDDVWSLGVLIWELLARGQRVPFADISTKEAVAEALARGEILKCPDPTLEKHFIWKQLAQPCFSGRLRRPDLDDVIRSVEKFQESESISQHLSDQIRQHRSQS